MFSKSFVRRSILLGLALVLVAIGMSSQQTRVEAKMTVKIEPRVGYMVNGQFYDWADANVQYYGSVGGYLWADHWNSNSGQYAQSGPAATPESGVPTNITFVCGATYTVEWVEPPPDGYPWQPWVTVNATLLSPNGQQVAHNPSQGYGPGEFTAHTEYNLSPSTEEGEYSCSLEAIEDGQIMKAIIKKLPRVLLHTFGIPYAYVGPIPIEVATQDYGHMWVKMVNCSHQIANQYPSLYFEPWGPPNVPPFNWSLTRHGQATCIGTIGGSVSYCVPFTYYDQKTPGLETGSCYFNHTGH